MAQNRDIEKLKRDPNLWRIAQSRIPDLDQQGAEYKSTCPFHSEKTPSFTVRTDDDGVWLYKCFGCNANGNLVQMVERLDKIPFAQAIEKVKNELGWRQGREKVEQTFQPIKKEKDALVFALDKLEPARIALRASETGRAWFDSRGIAPEVAAAFCCGYVQSARAINPHHPWVDEGWILFPTLSDDGKTVISLKYRSVKGKKTEDGTPGFLRKSGMTTGLFGSDKIEPFEDVYLVEGEPDALVMAQAGYIAVSLPSAGFNLTPEMRDRLMQANKIFLAGDTDGPGEQAMTKLWTELRERTYKMKWPEGMKDANQTFLEKCAGNVEVFRKEVEALKRKALEQPIPFVYDLRETLRAGNYVRPMDNPARLRFPWTQIDSWGAILPGDIMALSATETGQGKTSWLMNVLLENCVKYGKTIVNFTAELAPTQYSVRAAAYMLGKRKDEITDADLDQASELLGEGKFYNGYKPGANWKEAIELLTWAKRRLGADIIALDHLHFLTRNERDETRAQSEAMRMLKDLAVEYNTIVIVVGQPRKPLANHRGREAVTQDLKGSEALGSDASQVFILHRDRKSNGDDENMPIFDPVCKVKLDKSRESEPRATKLFFDGARCTFTLLEKNYGEYDE